MLKSIGDSDNDDTDTIHFYLDGIYIRKLDAKTEMVQMEIVDVRRVKDPIEPAGENIAATVILQDVISSREIRIALTLESAASIAWYLHPAGIERPLTFEFFLQCVNLLGGKVVSVQIVGLRNGVWYATVKLDKGGVIEQIDCRPSDALALSLVSGAKIYIALTLLDQEGRPLNG